MSIYRGLYMRLVPPMYMGVGLSAVGAFVGQRIQVARTACKMTVGDLSAATGIAAARLRQYETGKVNTVSKDIYEIARALKLPLSHFFDARILFR